MRRRKRRYKPRFFVICIGFPCLIIGLIIFLIAGSSTWKLEYETQATLPKGAESQIEDFTKSAYNYMATWKDGDLMKWFDESYYEEALVCQSAYDLLVDMRSLKENDLRFKCKDVVITITGIEETEAGYEIEAKEAYSCKFPFMDDVSETQGVESKIKLVKDGDDYRLSYYEREEDFYSYMAEGYEYGNDSPEKALKDKKEDILSKYKEQLEYFNEQRESIQVVDNPVEVLYDREAAEKYALKYALQRNDDDWYVFDDLGGNCQNFGSQVMYAGGIPMDLKGDAVWKYYDTEPDESNSKKGRSTSWSGVTYFYDYALANDGFGLCAQVDANIYSAEAGDIMQVGDGTGDYVHTIVSLGEITDKDGNVIDINTVSNTTDRKNYPLSAYNCIYVRLIKIYGYNN